MCSTLFSKTQLLPKLDRITNRSAGENLKNVYQNLDIRFLREVQFFCLDKEPTLTKFGVDRVGNLGCVSKKTCKPGMKTLTVERLVKQTHRPVSMGAAFSNVPSSDISAINPSPIRLFDFLDSPVGVLEVFGGGWSNPIFPSAAI